MLQRIEDMIAGATADIAAVRGELFRFDAKYCVAVRAGGEQTHRLIPVSSAQFSMKTGGCMSNQAV